MEIDYTLCLLGFGFGLVFGLTGSLLSNIIKYFGALITGGKGE